MQELLGLVEQMFDNAKTIEVESAINDVINIITQQGLEKEKEQIIDAYNQNITGFDKLEQEEIGLNWAEDYYNQTYNQNK